MARNKHRKFGYFAISHIKSPHLVIEISKVIATDGIRFGKYGLHAHVCQPGAWARATAIIQAPVCAISHYFSIRAHKLKKSQQKCTRLVLTRQLYLTLLKMSVYSYNIFRLRFRRRKTLISNRGRWSPLSLFRQVHLGVGKSENNLPSQGYELLQPGKQ